MTEDLCLAGRALRSSRNNPADLASLKVALESPASATVLAATLKRNGINLGETTIRKHRRGICLCHSQKTSQP